MLIEVNRSVKVRIIKPVKVLMPVELEASCDLASYTYLNGKYSKDMKI
jgi:hypothetical protein